MSKLRAVVRQNRRSSHIPFVPDQCIYVERHHGNGSIGIGCYVGVNVKGYYCLVQVVGFGWEGDEFVLNIA